MEEKKQDYSSTQDDLGLSSKLIPKSILKVKESPVKNTNQRVIRKSKTMVNTNNEKRVSFPDKFKRPLHTVFEVEPIIYENVEVKPQKVSKSKGCACIIF